MILHMAYDGKMFYFSDIIQGRIIGLDAITKIPVVYESKSLKPTNTEVKLDSNDLDYVRLGVAGLAVQVNIFKGKHFLAYF